MFRNKQRGYSIERSLWVPLEDAQLTHAVLTTINL